jgi:uncharacterized membrane protein YqaE (UPF0057 family)
MRTFTGAISILLLNIIAIVFVKGSIEHNIDLLITLTVFVPFIIFFLWVFNNYDKR